MRIYRSTEYRSQHIAVFWSRPLGVLCEELFIDTERVFVIWFKFVTRLVFFPLNTGFETFIRRWEYLYLPLPLLC